MYVAGLERLEEAGLEQYEISNVARPDRASRHNLKYWSDGEWFGFGCGAHSTVGNRRWKNVSSTTEYVDRVRRGEPVAENGRRLGQRSAAVHEHASGPGEPAGAARRARATDDAVLPRGD